MPHPLAPFLHSSFISLALSKVCLSKKISVHFIKKRYKYSSDNKVLAQSDRSKAKAIKVDVLRVEFRIAFVNIKLTPGFYRDHYLKRLPRTF